LRTRFEMVEDEVRQIISPETPLDFQVTHLQGGGVSPPTPPLTRLVEQEMERPFDLSQLPLPPRSSSIAPPPWSSAWRPRGSHRSSSSARARRPLARWLRASPRH
jgi:hypothetical protein